MHTVGGRFFYWFVLVLAGLGENDMNCITWFVQRYAQGKDICLILSVNWLLVPCSVFVFRDLKTLQQKSLEVVFMHKTRKHELRFGRFALFCCCFLIENTEALKQVLVSTLCYNENTCLSSLVDHWPLSLLFSVWIIVLVAAKLCGFIFVTLSGCWPSWKDISRWMVERRILHNDCIACFALLPDLHGNAANMSSYPHDRAQWW